MLTPKPTADEIRAIRETKRIGLMDATRQAMREWHMLNLHRIKVDALTGARTNPFTLIVDLVELLETEGV